MSSRRKFEVRREASMSMGFTLEMLHDSRRSRLAHMRVMYKAKQEKKEEPEAASEIEIRQPKITFKKPTTVYLYLQLQKITNIPLNADVMKLRLKDDINKVKYMSNETDNDQIKVNMLATNKPTFTIRIDQDSVDELNAFSDNPLTIMLYESVRRTIRIKEGERSTETFRGDMLLAEGHIDLLQFFTKERQGSIVDTFLYPKDPTATADQGTCKMSWQIYSLLPLLKSLTFSNIIFITFESIYNAPQDIIDMADELTADLYFQSIIPDKNKEYKKVKICDFSTFEACIIAQQNTNMRWESLTSEKERSLSNMHPTMSTHLGIKTVPTHKLLKGLLCSEDLNTSLHDISITEDISISCNTVRRYTLVKQLTNILEDVVAFNEQHILLELHHANEPDKILLQGVLDLSIFLYPKVNSCRFAVALHPPSQSPHRDKSSIMQRNNGKATTLTKMPFAVINLCLLSPITEVPIERRLEQLNINACQPIPSIHRLMTTSKKSEIAYKEFDELMQELIDDIITNNVRSFEAGKEFLCCHLGNISNKILKLIQFDFNVRYPTKTNIEFNKLLTTVYKDIMIRVRKIVKTCSEEKVNNCSSLNNIENRKIIRFVSILKYLLETDEKDLSDVLMRKLEEKKQRAACISFYMMLYDLEKQRYDAVKKYFEKPIKDKYIEYEYYSGLISIYVEYMEHLEREETFNEALQCVLIRLKAYSELHPSKIESFILLFCFYKSCSYAPGMSYTRWKYENLYGCEDLSETIPSIPKSRWSMYHIHKLTFDTLKGINFYKMVRLMTHLGMYKFAEMIYKEIAAESKNELQKYLVWATFRTIQNDIPADYKLQHFATEKLPFPEEAAAYQEFINGNANFCRGKKDAAMQNYEHIIDMYNLDNLSPYRLGVLRYAYEMVEQERYEKAITALKKIDIVDHALVPNVHLGKIMYKLNRLKEAEVHFSAATKYQLHIPDVWAYLALINLKLGHMYKAMESWKYARIHPDAVISDEILQELHKIDPEELVLYVDKPYVRQP